MSPDGMEYYCNICNTMYGSKTDLQDHLAMHYTRIQDDSSRVFSMCEVKQEG